MWFLPSGKSPTSTYLIGVNLSSLHALHKAETLQLLGRVLSQCALPLLLTIVVSIPDSILLIPPQTALVHMMHPSSRRHFQSKLILAAQLYHPTVCTYSHIPTSTSPISSTNNGNYQCHVYGYSYKPNPLQENSICGKIVPPICCHYCKPLKNLSNP